MELAATHGVWLPMMYDQFDIVFPKLTIMRSKLKNEEWYSRRYCECDPSYRFYLYNGAPVGVNYIVRWNWVYCNRNLYLQVSDEPADVLSFQRSKLVSLFPSLRLLATRIQIRPDVRPNKDDGKSFPIECAHCCYYAKPHRFNHVNARPSPSISVGIDIQLELCMDIKTFYYMNRTGANRTMNL